MHNNTMKQNYVYAFVRMSFGCTTIFKSLLAINVEHLDYLGFAISPIISSQDVHVDLIFNLAQSLSILSVYHWLYTGTLFIWKLVYNK